MSKKEKDNIWILVLLIGMVIGGVFVDSSLGWGKDFYARVNVKDIAEQVCEIDGQYLWDYTYEDRCPGNNICYGFTSIKCIGKGLVQEKIT